MFLARKCFKEIAFCNLIYCKKNQDIWLQFLKGWVAETILAWMWTFCVHTEILDMYK